MDSGAQARMRPIIEGVLKLYGMTRQEMVTESKRRGPVEARSACCWLARRLKIAVTITEMANMLGVKSHGSVRQGIERIENLRQRDRWLREGTDALLAELSA
jgi:chromosomal replication initiation ATPase DnaA